jgi:CRISPR type IV-associated protein Csf3
VYRLDIDLSAPVAASDPYIHLDALLSYAAGIETLGFDGLQDLDEDEVRYFREAMPLHRYQHDGEWVWACSAATIAGGEDAPDKGEWSTTRWRKRFDVDDEHQTKRTQINVTAGEFKSYNATLPYTPADRLEFLFECPDPDRVVEMIEEHVPAVGKKRSQGFGRIRSVSWSEVSEAVDSAILRDGRTLRSLPAEFIDGTPTGVRIERRTTKPPYWHAENQSMAYPPFQDLDGTGLAEGVDRG